MTTHDQADSAISPQEPARGPSKVKRVLLGIAGFLVALGAAYGVGRLQGLSEVRGADARTVQAEQKRQAADAELKLEQQKVSRLRARLHLHLAVLALDERNFGIAQSEIEQTGRQLAEAGAGDKPELSKIATQLQAHKLIATEDLGAQRQKLLAWARALDAHL